MRPIPTFTALILLSLAGLTALSLAGPSDPKKLVVRGRTSDAEGFPIEKVRVWVEGSHAQSVISDIDGVYALEIPLGTPTELRQKPVSIVVRAERKGWRFAIPGARSALRLELGVEVDAEGVAHSVARSNDDRFAAAAARAVGMQDAVGLLVIPFLGEPGEALYPATGEALDQTARAALDFSVGGSVPAPPVATAPGTEAPRATAPSSTSPAAVATPVPTPAPTPRPAPSPTPRPAPSPPPSPRPAPSPSPTPRPAPAPSPAISSPPLPSAPATLSPAPGALGRSSAATRRENEREIRLRERRLRDSLDALVRQANRRTKRGASRETFSSPRNLPAPKPPREPEAASTIAREDTSQIVHPEPPLRAGRSRPRPLVVRAPGSEDPPERADCLCHVEGTLEVRSGQPLRRPERVEVTLQGFPRLKDTVELFMGSPRFFMIPEVPCGMHRLQIRVLSGRRYQVGSRDAMGYFRCSRDRRIQRKVVLEPF